MMNYMNPFNYKSSSNETKEIKSSFMPKINREPKDNKFKKLSKYFTQNLFRYFNHKEIYELGKINVFFMNNLIEYLENNETWPEKVRKLKCKYNFKIYQNEVDQTLNQAKINKRRYKYPQIEKQGINYLQFDEDGNRYISIASSFNWAHSNNESYWRKEKVPGSYEKDQDVFYLIDVCWIGTTFSFYHVSPNNYYKFYINEYFNNQRKLENRMKLNIILGENKIIYQEKFPSAKIFAQNSGPKENVQLKEDFICYIKKEDFENVPKDENGDCIVKIEFSHCDNFWKSGWFIDGGSLVEISKEQLEKEEKKAEKKADNINLRRLEEEEDKKCK